MRLSSAATGIGFVSWSANDERDAERRGEVVGHFIGENWTAFGRAAHSIQLCFSIQYCKCTRNDTRHGEEKSGKENHLFATCNAKRSTFDRMSN